MSLTIGSLFSGIGGLELGLEMAGLGPVVFQVEIDPFCRSILTKHWPEASRHDDVRTVGAHSLPYVDVLCGGFPCQDISKANRRAVGIAGPRSGLWSEFFRIAGELRPRFVVVENVAALLGRGLDRVLADLAAIGMDAIWFPLSVADVGGPHLRERIFVVAYVDPLGQRRGRQGQHPQRLHGQTRHDAAPLRQRPLRHDPPLHQGPPRPPPWPPHSTTRPDMVRVPHGLPARVDRIAAIGNAVSPHVAEVVGHVVRQLDTR